MRPLILNFNFYSKGVHIHLLFPLRIGLLDNQMVSDVKGKRRVRAGLWGRHSRPRQHLALHVYAGDVLWRSSPASHVNNRQWSDHNHAAKLLLEMAQLVSHTRPLEYDISLLELVSIHLLAIRALVRRVHRLARLPQRHQIKNHRDHKHLGLFGHHYDWHIVCYLVRVWLGPSSIAIVSKYWSHFLLFLLFLFQNTCIV